MFRYSVFLTRYRKKGFLFSMIRMFIFLVFICAAAFAITWLSGMDGWISARYGAKLYEVPVGTMIGVILVVGLILMLSTSLLKDLIGLPAKLRRKRADGRREKGMAAFKGGLTALMAGDADEALRYAKSANKQLDEPDLTRLLTAQAAQMSGDHELAEENFSAMLDAPETQFMGLRGLYQQAMTAGNIKEAQEYAESAFKLRPNASWAFDSVYKLSVDRGAWGNAQDALKLAGKNNLVDKDTSRRKEAALLTAAAYAAEAAGDTKQALKDAEAAVKLAPEFAPAATLAATIHAEAGHTGKAGKIIEVAYEAEPHPALGRTYEELLHDVTPARRTARIIKMAQKKADNDESQLLMAEQHIVLEEWDEAATKIEPLLKRNPTSRTFSAMAAAMRGKHGDDAAQVWLAKAAQAPRDPRPGADGAFHFTTDGWRRLVVEFGEHGRLSPPPLEEVSAALSSDEIKLLTAPPPEPEPEPEIVPEPEVEVEAEQEDALDEAEDAQVDEEEPEELIVPPRPDA